MRRDVSLISALGIADALAPSISVMMSPASRPSFAAGLSGTTAEIASPRASGSAENPKPSCVPVRRCSAAFGENKRMCEMPNSRKAVLTTFVNVGRDVALSRSPFCFSRKAGHLAKSTPGTKARVLTVCWRRSRVRCFSSGVMACAFTACVMASETAPKAAMRVHGCIQRLNFHIRMNSSA